MALLVWRVLLDGRNPFSRFFEVYDINDKAERMELERDIQHMKTSEAVIRMAISDTSHLFEPKFFEGFLQADPDLRLDHFVSMSCEAANITL